MSRNPQTGIQIVAPADWALNPTASWVKAPPEPGAPPPPQRPRSMLIHSEAPYVDVLEETPHHYSAVHQHTEPEILVVLQGAMMLNGERVGAGAMIFIPAGEEYWHSTTEESCVVGVIRPGERGFLVGSRALQPAAPEAQSEPGAPGPYCADLAKGERRLWCACGRSASQPYCDGQSHRGTGVKPLPIRADEDRVVTLCGCKRSANAPYCDGSHRHGDPIRAPAANI
jgi:CDGSH-type Zn-finger protein/mannose-6-phosphate isomerase-like protein (cupin superfamily)